MIGMEWAIVCRLFVLHPVLGVIAALFAWQFGSYTVGFARKMKDVL
jgi:hypothetical protein